MTTAAAASAAPQYQVKLLAALRSGDPALIHPFLSEISKERHKSSIDIAAGTFRASTSNDDEESVSSGLDTGAAALHLAIRCASAETVSLLLNHRAISPNGVHPPSSGTTPLHLAASLGRVDVVALLLDQDTINDTLLDSSSKTARDIALEGKSTKSKEVVRLIDDSREVLNARFRGLLRSYILSSSPSDPSPSGQANGSSSASAEATQELIQLLQNPRSKWINVSYLDDDSGTSLLHEAARRKDLGMIQAGVKAGADVFVRDRRGRTPYEGGKGDDKAKAFLKQLANHDSSLLFPSAPSNSAPTGPPPPLRGYLNKYTNVAKGYSTRWFVLQDGYLSYFRRQEDESVACRGSVSMKTASIRYAASSQSTSQHSSAAHGPATLRFEIIPSHGAQKWYIRANHPIEANRWTRAIEDNIEWYRRQESISTSANFNASVSGLSRSDSMQSTTKVGSALSAAPQNYSSSTTSLGSSMKRTVKGSIFGRASMKSRVSSSTAPMMEIASSAASIASRTSDVSGQAPGQAGASNGGYESDDGRSANASLAPAGTSAPGSGSGSRYGSPNLVGEPEAMDASSFNRDQHRNEGSEYDSEEEEDGVGREPPHEESYGLEINSVQMQMELTMQLLSSVTSSASPPSQDLQCSLNTLNTTLGTLLEHTTARQTWYQKQLKRERQRAVGLEESFALVVREGEELEGELRKRARKRGGVSSPVPAGGDTVKDKRPSVKDVFDSAASIKPSERASASERPVSGEHPATHVSVQIPTPTTAVPTKIPLLDRRETAESATGTIRASADAGRTYIPQDEDDEGNTDEEDEFFDAIESGNLPNLVVPAALASPGVNAEEAQPSLEQDTSSVTTPTTQNGTSTGNDNLFSALAIDKVKRKEGTSSIPLPLGPTPTALTVTLPSYEHYNSLRSRLKIGNDSRPAVSLWSVLRHNIGKDLTKISFPVSFNEPTSMLQRMAEDMEFSECLDCASKEPDQFMRIAFVAAFAMSNYSSTIGRIAKPFNPMLSETFEYCRPDKQYRYISEQVSHHPPISACWAEGPLWRYFGEVDAQNKFMGKSFEIRPTGVAHVELVLPSDMVGSGYPAATKRFGQGKVLEHYTWKKVTTNVSGFILGSPTIDHYGDMEIVNHRTQDRCVLTFKPRGWRGRDAYEIIGRVQDASGRTRLDIAGRWNSQLVCRIHGASGGLHPDVAVPSAYSGSSPSSPSDPNSPQHILLWRNSQKPAAPFNLTPFSITLNDLPKSMEKNLPSTDCRLRPDQRAFEEGRYEQANLLKIKQEERQRAIRKEREEGKREKHKPRWFSAETDRDTGERVWAPSKVGGDGDDRLEYWEERERVIKESRTRAVMGENEAEEKQHSRWKAVDQIFIEAEED